MADMSGLDPTFAESLQGLINASGGQVWVNSGYRTPERQGQLYQAALAKYGSEEEARMHVAPPGKSNHNFGLAVDLGGNLALAAQLAPRFGLRFPMGYEPWHIEPIWARSKRGQDYKDAMVPPPPGATADPHGDPYTSLHTQLTNFTQILQGVSGEELDKQYNVSGPDPGGVGGSTEIAKGGGTTSQGAPANAVTWAHDFLSMNGFPTSEANMRAMEAWIQAEGGLANNNPLNTTQSGFEGESAINSVGVKRYATYDDSLKANSQALHNGRYQNIIEALQKGNDPLAVADAIANSPWGSGELVRKVLQSG